MLAIFSLIDGYLLSAISFVGKTGINLFYTEYKFLKSWWKGALLVFIVWMLLFSIQSYFQKKTSKGTSKIVHAVSLIIAVIGGFLSYVDFRNSVSHRWLGEQFHVGVYLFWLGWMAISIFLLTDRKSVDDSNYIQKREEG